MPVDPFEDGEAVDCVGAEVGDWVWLGDDVGVAEAEGDGLSDGDALTDGYGLVDGITGVLAGAVATSDVPCVGVAVAVVGAAE